MSEAHELVAVVTRPDRGARSRRSRPIHPACQFAHDHDVKLLVPETVNSHTIQDQILCDFRPDVFFVCDYGEILRADTLRVPGKGGINLHGSLLPSYRGAAPIAWAILDGVQRTGVSVIHMSPRLDAGPVIAARTLGIDPDENAMELEHRLAIVGVNAVLESLRILEAWDGVAPLGTPQNPKAASKAPRLTRAMGVIRWEKPAAEIVNQIRALQPWPGAFTFARRSTSTPIQLHVLKATPTDGAESPHAGAAVPGEVHSGPHGEFLVRCGSQWLRLESVKAENRGAVNGADFLRGFRMGTPEILGPV